MDRYACRKAIVADLEAEGYLVKAEPYSHNVGTCYRCHNDVEPLISAQWFVKMAPLAKEAIRVVEDGTINFVPERFTKTYINWMENVHDWCISRQLWWGHQIPAWYCDECGHINVSRTDPTKCEKCGCTHLTREEDVLDTWFSSALWPFSTMGWPDLDAADLNYWYPTSVMVTGYDIIFFWVARMIMAGYRFQHDKPFSNVFFTSIIRDKIGRKMSKSLGNSPDPLDLIANYGADGLRFGLMRIAPTGTDVRFDENQISEGRNFANKLYNATRFRLMQGDARGETAPHYSSVHISIISRLKQLHADVEKALADYEFNSLIQTLYQFFWNEYCDRFLEAVKGDLKDGADPAARAATLTTMDTVLRHYLALLHPVMPHITEELWASLGFAECNGGLPLMRTPLPSAENLLAGLDEVDILALEGFFKGIDLVVDVLLVVLGELVAVLADELLALIDHLVCAVSDINFLAALLVFLSELLSLVNSLLDILLGHVGRRGDGDRLLLAGAQILCGNMDYAVCIDIEGNFDLRHASACGHDAVEVEHAEGLVILSEVSLALEDMDFN